MSKTMFLGNTSPSLTDEITNALDNNKPIDLSGKTVKFRMRKFNSNILKVDATASVVNASRGQVQYDWSAADTDTEGSFFAWWTVSQGSSVLDTPEFEIVVDSHAPGMGTTTGAIADGVKLYIPETLYEMRKEGKFSDRQLQTVVDDMKFKLFATVVDVAAEATVYSSSVIDHISKLVTIRVIPAGVDFWNNALISQAVTGTNESNSYPDRRKGLWDIRAKLQEDVAVLGIELGPDGSFVLVQRSKRSKPAVSVSQPNALTPDPLDTPPIGYPAYCPPVPSVLPPRIIPRPPRRFYP